MKWSSCCTRPASSSHLMIGALALPDEGAAMSVCNSSRDSSNRGTCWRDMNPIQDDRPHCKLAHEEVAADMVLLSTMTMVMMLMWVLVLMLMMYAQQCVAQLNRQHTGACLPCSRLQHEPVDIFQPRAACMP
jgi:hypothetical protein